MTDVLAAELPPFRTLAAAAWHELDAEGDRHWQNAEPWERAGRVAALIAARAGLAASLEQRGYLGPDGLEAYLADAGLTNGAKAGNGATPDALEEPPGWWAPDGLAPATASRDPVERLGSRALSAVSQAPPEPMLLGRVDPEAHSILQGTGDTGKGTLVSSWAVRLVEAGHVVLLLDYENHPGEWARRCAGLGGSDVLDRIHHVAPLTAEWTGTRGPLWAQAADIRELVERLEATYAVVDSIVVACAGSDPMKPETPALYAGAIQRFGLPVLSIAHVNRADDLRYPFGSVFWHNLARVTWSLKRDGERAILQCRKANNYANPGRFVVEVTWRDERPVEVWERGYSVALAERIDEALGGDALAVSAIVAQLNEDRLDDEEAVKADSIRKALRRGITTGPNRPQRYTVEGAGDTAKYRRVTA